jgi:hypothetical protein
MFKVKLKIIFVGIILLALPSIVSADYLGQKVDFSVEPIYDLNQRNQIAAVLIYISDNLYFYFDNDWWASLDYNQQTEVRKATGSLDEEFTKRIYPTLTSNFGFEPKPGIDKDNRITVLIHQMASEAGGYFNNGNGYSRLQFPRSNEREMVYLNSKYLGTSVAKSFLAHEFMHLITFNQKDILRGVTEETWLNEARSEYAPTLLGYDEAYEGSNLQRRVKSFMERPGDSLTEWQGNSYDYGALNIFTQYLVDHYGVKILVDSLHSSKVGIPSLNEALIKNGFKEDFSQIFTDWMITVLVNDCDLAEKYCYKNQNLKKFIITPFVNFLPFVGKSSLSMTDFTKEWAGNWYKIIGGKGVLKLEFSGTKGVKFKVPYVITNELGKREIKFLELDNEQKGTLFVPDFNAQNVSLTIILSAQSKISGFGSSEPAYQFSFVISTVERTPEEEAELIKGLLVQIEELQKEIKRVQTQINIILGKEQTQASCLRLESNLYYGMMGNSEIRCLQEFLKSQGPEIYPEGLMTGNFLELTRKAVIRFQEKYATEILSPVGLEQGTGFVGEKTRMKINQLLGF